MSERNCMELLRAKWAEGKFVCVGLDSDYDKIPKTVYKQVRKELEEAPAMPQIFYQPVTITRTFFTFNCAIVEATADYVCAYKINSAFYEAYGAPGLEALENTIAFIHHHAPTVPVIYDAKRADIGNTNDGYVKAAFDYLKADAITVHPYLGQEALRPFLKRPDKGIFVLCRTSNPGAGEFQDIPEMLSDKTLEAYEQQRGRPLGPAEHVHLYQYVAYRAACHWNTNNNVGLVVGATFPLELEQVRQIVGDMPILIPGVGSQGGDLEASVRAGMDSQKMGFIINSSRGIIFASSGEGYAEAAHRETIKLHDAINQIRLAA